MLGDPSDQIPLGPIFIYIYLIEMNSWNTKILNLELIWIGES